VQHTLMHMEMGQQQMRRHPWQHPLTREYVVSAAFVHHRLVGCSPARYKQVRQYFCARSACCSAAYLSI
jgi:hypothetical protein